MSMTPLDLRNAVPLTEIEAGIRLGRRLRAEALRDIVGRMSRHSRPGNRCEGAATL